MYPEYSTQLTCVIDLFGIADVRRWGFRAFIGSGKSAEDLRILDLVSPITHVTAQTVPTLLIHGTADPRVPFSQAEALVERLNPSGVPHEFISIKAGCMPIPLRHILAINRPTCARLCWSF